MCKCGARVYECHLAKIEQGYSAHVYTGFFWTPAQPEESKDHG